MRAAAPSGPFAHETFGKESIMPTPEKLSSNLAQLALRLRDWWRRTQELASMDRTELNRIAAEFGMSAADVRLLVERGPDAASLFHRRLETLGLSRADVEHIAPGLTRDLERTCACCDSKKTCAADLDRDPADAGWQDYCPNAISLESVRRSKGRFPA
jgi:hypothetical protein